MPNPNHFRRICQSGGSVGREKPFSADLKTRPARFGLPNPNHFRRICQSGGSVGREKPFSADLKTRPARFRLRRAQSSASSVFGELCRVVEPSNDCQIRTISAGFVNPAGAVALCHKLSTSAQHRQSIGILVFARKASHFQTE